MFWNPDTKQKTYRLPCNVGRAEAVLRVGAGLAVIGLGIAFRSWWGLVGLVPFLTGILRYCPLWRVVGFDTCAQKRP